MTQHTHRLTPHAFIVAVATLLIGACASTAQPQDRAPSATPAYDLLIRNGRVIDGSGAPWFRADVGVRDGHIAAIGNLRDQTAKEEIDAHGQIIAPGFIDMHSHSDLALLRDGRGLSKIHQGVTTEIIGEGVSVAPRHAEDHDGNYGITPDWTTLDGYFARLQKSGTSGNVMSYISAGQLRNYVMGEGAQRRATPAELEQMKALLAQGMKEGAAGLVMALETPGAIQFPPEGSLSLAMPTTDDLIELARVAAQYGGIYASHLRDQGDHFEDGIREAALIGEKAGIPVEIFHLKAAGRPNFGKMAAALATIHDARAHGIDIAADVYPYTAASHPLSVEIPRWAHEGGSEKMLQRLADPKLRPRLRAEVEKYMTTKYYNEDTGASGADAVIVSSVPNHPERYVGKTIGEIARGLGKDPYEEVLDLSIEQHNKVGIVMYYMSEKDMRLALRDPLLSIDSDGTAVSPDFGGRPHPRYYGTFVRVLGRYARDEKVISLEEAVRKMTSLPAQRMGLLDRGLVRPGMCADLVVFDPDRVIDRATFDQPHQYAAGISDVIVNGTTVIRDGEHTGALPGRPLRGRGYQGGTD